MLSPRARLIGGFALANLLLLAIAATVWLGRPPQPPQIQGVLMAEARPLAPFSLLDHNNRRFDNNALTGRWHLVSYGFTTCPDVCPTTLSTLASVMELLQAGGVNPPQVLFYTVDHRRDTVSQLAAYVPFFSSDFVGLTHLDDSANPHLPFENSLGIFAKLTPLNEEVNGEFINAYDVAHGVNLFLLNPAGELQAVFEPGEDKHGLQVFDADQIYRDYRKVITYLEAS
jgi:protein SCO1